MRSRAWSEELVFAGIALAGAAVAAILAVRATPQIGLGAILLVPTAILAARAPEMVLLAALVLVTTEGSAQSFFDFRPFPVIQGLLAAFAIGTVGRFVFTRREEPLILRVWVMPMILFLLVSVVGILVASSFSQGLNGFRQGAYYILIGGFVALAVTDEASRRRLTRGIALIAFFIGAYATYRLIVGADPRELANASADRRNVLVGEEPGLFGSFTQRDSLATWSAYTIPLCLAGALVWRDLYRLVAAFACVLGIVALLGTQVRTALPAVVLGILAVVLIHAMTKARPGLRLGTTGIAVIAIALVGTAAWAVTVAGDPVAEARYANILTPDEDATFGNRQYRWPEAIALAEQHPFGLGLGSSGRAVTESDVAQAGTRSLDNSYIQIAIEQGFGGLILFIGALLSLVAGLAWHGIRSADGERAVPLMAATGAILCTATFMYTSSSFGGLASLAVWVTVGIGVGGVVVGARRLSGEADPTSPALPSR